MGTCPVERRGGGLLPPLTLLTLSFIHGKLMPAILANANGCVLKFGVALGQRLGHKKAKNHQAAEKAQHFIQHIGNDPPLFGLCFAFCLLAGHQHIGAAAIWTNHILFSLLVSCFQLLFPVFNYR